MRSFQSEVSNLVRCEMGVLLGRASQGNKTMLDRVQITRLEGSIPTWQMHDLEVFSSQLRYALRASEEQIKEAVNLKPGQQMLIDLYPGGYRPRSTVKSQNPSPR
jgi:hypothetical protein